MIEPEEEINILYILKNPVQYNNAVNYSLLQQGYLNFKVYWRGLFEQADKSISYIFKMKHLSDNFTIQVLEKPKSHIIIDEYFKVLLQFFNKTNSTILN